jgi:hypothetical protein
MKRAHLILLSILIAVAAIAVAAMYRYYHPLAPATRAVFAATQSQPATTQLAAKPARKPRGPATQILDIARADDPKYPTTRPLDEKLDLKYAAHVPVSNHIYLDYYGHLWITRPDAPDTFDFTKAIKEQTATHVVRDQVVFVYWAPNDAGTLLSYLIVKSRTAEAPYELVDYDGRRPLADPHGFDFSRALVLYGPGQGQRRDRIIVPTKTGVAAFHFHHSPEEIAASYQQLIEPMSDRKQDHAIQLIMDLRGVIAWVTNAAGTIGGRGIARFAPLPRDPNNADADAPLEYKWTVLTGKPGWPDGILHLVPLLDGSVLQIVSTDGQKVTFSVNAVEATPINEQDVLKHVLQLSAEDEAKREAAFKELTKYGPGIAPILEKSLDLLEPEAQIRVRQLLRSRIEPGLGAMSLLDGKMKVVSRYPDGGVLFFAEAGVSIPRGGEETPAYVTPAWLSVRPGRAVELLPDVMVSDIRAGQQTIIAYGTEYLVLDDLFGPQRFIGNRLEPLLRKSERQYKEFVGIDTTGRWIFRAPDGAPPATQPATQSTTRAATSAASTQDSGLSTQDSFLVLDPRLPDITPRLPGWQLPNSAKPVGWDKDHWPVIYMDVRPKPVPWALIQGGWRVIDPQKETVFVDPKDVPRQTPPPPRATTAPTTTTTPSTATTTAATAPTTQDSAPDAADFLLLAPDSTAYYDGKESLRLVKPDGSIITWPLPSHAVGTLSKPTLLRTGDGLLFLFNEPGRILRIRANLDPDTSDFREGEPPFQLEATFTRKVPNDATPLRIWLDPADRICIAHDQTHITMFFPLGRIPPALSSIMPVEELATEE